MIKRLWYSLLSNDKPQDKNVIWIDTSNSESFTLKLYRNGGWKPLQVVGTSRDMIERELTGYVTSHYHSYDRIINKPTTLEGYGITDCFNKKEVEKLLDNKVTKVDGMSLTSNNFSDKYKKMLDDLSTSYYNKKNVDNLLNEKQDVISDLESIREGAKKGSTALQSFTETDPIYLKDKPNIALKSDLLNDNNLVHKEGDEDIKGSKWFEHIRTGNFGIFQEDNNNHSVYIDYHYDESNYLPILHFDSEEDWLTILDNIADPVDDFHAANKHYVDEGLATKANLQHQHMVADITDFPELYYDATAFFTSETYPSDKYGELLEAVKAKKTVYATIDESGHISYVFFMSSANSDSSSSRVLLTTIFADGSYLYLNTFVLQQSGMTPLQESITSKADKATTLAGYGIADAYTKSELDELLKGKQSVLTDTDGGYGQRVAELEKKGIASQEKLSELEEKGEELNLSINGGTAYTQLSSDSIIEDQYINPNGTASSLQGDQIYVFNIANYSSKKIRLKVASVYSSPYWSLYAIVTLDGSVLKKGNTLNNIITPYEEVIDLSLLEAPAYLRINKPSRAEVVVERIDEVESFIDTTDSRLNYLEDTIRATDGKQYQGIYFGENANIPRDAIINVSFVNGDNLEVQAMVAEHAPRLYLGAIYNVGGAYSPIVRLTDDPTSPLEQIFSWYLTDQTESRTGVETIRLVCRKASTWGLPITPAIDITIDWDKLPSLRVVPSDIYFVVAELPIIPNNPTDLTEAMPSIKAGSLAGKTFVCFGDSFTETTKANPYGFKYPDMLKELTGAEFVNVGIGGACVAPRLTQEYDTPTSNAEAYTELDLENMIKAVCTGDYSKQIAAANYLAQAINDDNRDVITRLSAIDWDKVDAITILAGTNDWFAPNRKTKTMESIGNIIRLLGTAYPNIKIYWFSPTIRWIDWANGVGDVSKFSDNYNVEGNGTLLEFSENIITKVKKCHIPVCDLYNTLGWTQYNFGNYFMGNDGTHPRTFAGVTSLAKRMLSFILANNTLY